jgi:hypothetical protein
MTVLVQIEHAIRDFAAWKTAFDHDPVHREASGVRRYRIFRPIDDPNYVAVDLEFDDAAKARAFREALYQLWRSPAAAPALMGEPRARIVEAVESGSY